MLLDDACFLEKRYALPHRRSQPFNATESDWTCGSQPRTVIKPTAERHSCQSRKRKLFNPSLIPTARIGDIGHSVWTILDERKWGNTATAKCSANKAPVRAADTSLGAGSNRLLVK